MSATADSFLIDPAHMGREKAKARELRASQWWKQLLAKGECHYCGGVFPKENLTMDHVVPLSRGGKSSRGNIVVACKDCNNRKRWLTPAEMVMGELAKP